jgi:ATP-dependent Clp protease ATP-binding subunit ClpC
LKNLDIDLKKIRQEVEKLVKTGPSMVTMGQLPFTPRAKKVSSSRSKKRRTSATTTSAPSTSCSVSSRKRTARPRRSSPTWRQARQVREEVLEFLGADAQQEQQEKKSRPASAGGGSKARGRNGPVEVEDAGLDSFGRDLTELAREGKLDPVIGRAKEIERVIQILSRRTKNNPVLLGEAGVGKTAIVEGLAQRSSRATSPRSS